MSETIRVLQIVTQMNRAGMESRLMDIYRNIDKEKIQFDFYTCREEPGIFDEEILRYGGKIFYNKPLKIKDLFRLSNRFYDFFHKHNEYQIVHCHLNQWSGIILNGAKKACVPVRIAHSRTALRTISQKNIIKNIIKTQVNFNATHKLAVSKKAGEWLFGKKAIKEGKVIIMPNAIDLDKYKFSLKVRNEYRTELSLGNSRTIVHVGNLRREKNHKYLLRVFYEVLQKDENAKLLIIGKDNMDGQIQKLAEELNISKSILFLGTRSDIDSLLCASDIFVFPSIYEGFPGAVLEAQAAGLPCVISSTITDEVAITNSLIKLDIKLNPESWAKTIVETDIEKRVESENILAEKGYGILELTKRMEVFYTRASSRKGDNKNE